MERVQLIIPIDLLPYAEVWCPPHAPPQHQLRTTRAAAAAAPRSGHMVRPHPQPRHQPRTTEAAAVAPGQTPSSPPPHRHSRYHHHHQQQQLDLHT